MARGLWENARTELRCIDAASFEAEQDVAAYHSNAVAHFVLTRYQDLVRRRKQELRAHRRRLASRPRRNCVALRKPMPAHANFWLRRDHGPMRRADTSEIEAWLGAA
jgi:hypothetical protein